MFAAMQSNMLHWMATDLRICHNHSKPLLRWWHPNKCTETSISLINLGCSHNYLSYKPQTHNGVLTYINILLILFNYLGRLVNWVFFGFWHTSTSWIISLFFGSPEFQAHQSPPELESHQKLTEMKRNAMIVQEAKSLALTSSACMESVRNAALCFIRVCKPVHHTNQKNLGLYGALARRHL